MDTDSISELQSQTPEIKYIPGLSKLALPSDALSRSLVAENAATVSWNHPSIQH